MKPAGWRQLCAAGLVALPTLSSAQATDLDIMVLSGELGTVLAAEEFCGLVLDPAAIADFISKKVPADRMDFPAQLNMSVMGAGVMQDNMGAAQKVAHCAAIKQSASYAGLSK